MAAIPRLRDKKYRAVLAAHGGEDVELDCKDEILRRLGAAWAAEKIRGP